MASSAASSAWLKRSRSAAPTWRCHPQAARSMPAGDSVRKSSSSRSTAFSSGRNPYPSASTRIHLLDGGGGKQAVAVLGPSRTTVPKRQLRRSEPAEVVEVAAGGDPAESGRLGHRVGRQP